MTPFRPLLALALALPLVAQDHKSWSSKEGWGLGQGNGLLHWEAGALVGASAFLVARALGYGDPKAETWLKRNAKPWMHAVAWSAAAGWWKESQDGKHPGVRGSWPDFTKTVLGGVTVAVVFHLSIKPPSDAYATAPPAPPAPPMGPCCAEDPQ